MPPPVGVHHSAHPQGLQRRLPIAMMLVPRSTGSASPYAAGSIGAPPAPTPVSSRRRRDLKASCDHLLLPQAGLAQIRHQTLQLLTFSSRNFPFVDSLPNSNYLRPEAQNPFVSSIKRLFLPPIEVEGIFLLIGLLKIYSTHVAVVFSWESLDHFLLSYRHAEYGTNAEGRARPYN